MKKIFCGAVIALIGAIYSIALMVMATINNVYSGDVAPGLGALIRGYYLMGGYVRQRQHGVKENDRELPDPACGGVSGLSAAYRLQH